MTSFPFPLYRTFDFAAAVMVFSSRGRGFSLRLELVSSSDQDSGFSHFPMFLRRDELGFCSFLFHVSRSTQGVALLTYFLFFAGAFRGQFF